MPWQSLLNPFLGKFGKKKKMPTEWKNGIIVNVKKIGDTSKCTNWRGITFLPMLSKVLNRILLTRIKQAVEVCLRKEQAGFREHWSCTDLINTLRIILEQSFEWQGTLYMAFMGFEKAFYSLNQDIMWHILEKYDLPKKIINIIKSSYDGYECRVIHEALMSNPIKVKSGVKQGCLLLPSLFVVLFDSIMRVLLRGCRDGIQWGIRERLIDLDFADDLFLLT